ALRSGRRAAGCATRDLVLLLLARSALAPDRRLAPTRWPHRSTPAQRSLGHAIGLLLVAVAGMRHRRRGLRGRRPSIRVHTHTREVVAERRLEEAALLPGKRPPRRLRHIADERRCGRWRGTANDPNITMTGHDSFPGSSATAHRAHPRAPFGLESRLR